METSWFGIDFGTTNSAAVSLTGVNEKALRTIKYGDDSGLPMPSLVAINKKTGKVIVGQQAKEQRNAMAQDYHFFSSIKSVIDSEESWNIAGNNWNADDIAAEIFKALKGRIKDNKDDVKDAVIAVPVGFAANKKKKLRDAANKAGITVKMFISEPTAAFCSNYKALKSCKNVAVFDWGGGTLDVVVLRVDHGCIQEIAAEGMNLAGDDIDLKLAEKMHTKFLAGKSNPISFDSLEPATKDQLIVKCEKMKCDFSDSDETIISLNKYDAYGAVRAKIGYDFFELLLENEVNAAMGCLRKALEKAKINKSSLDRILCVGGSSNLRPFREKIYAEYGALVYFPTDVIWNIAQGAAFISKRPGDYKLNKDMGMLLCDGSFFPLIEKGHSIPIPRANEKSFLFGITDKVDGINPSARFIFTDAENDNERTFTSNFLVPVRGFDDERIQVSCYIDQDFIFKLKAGTNKIHDDVARVWSYDNVKVIYKIED